MSDKIELKPCAFCGAEGARMKIVGSPDVSDIVHYRLHCDGCGTDGPAANTASKAETAWNMRPQAAFRFAACQVPDDESIQIPTGLVAMLIGALAEYAGEAEFELITDANQQFTSAIRTSPTAKQRDWIDLPVGPAYIGWMTDEEKSRIHAARSNQSGEPAEMAWCTCGDGHPTNSYGAGFIDGSGMCPNCDAAIPAKDIPQPAAEQPDAVKVPRELLEELRAFTLRYDSGRAGVMRGQIDALLGKEGA